MSWRFFWSKKRRKQASLALLAIIAADILWGTNIAANKAVLETVPPYTYAFLKLSFGAVVIGLLTFRQWKPVSRHYLLRMFLSSFVGVTLFLVLLYNGQARTDGTTAALILALNPIVLYFYSIRFLHEKFKPNLLVGSLIALAGVILIIGYSQSSPGSLIGGLLILAAVLLDGLGVISKKKLIEKFPTEQIVAFNFIFAAPFFALLMLLELPNLSIADISTSSWVALIYSSIMSAVVGFLLFYWGLRYIAVERASVFHYLIPTFGVIASLLVLGESLELSVVFGAFLVFGGLALSEVKIPHDIHFLHRHKH